MSVEFYPDDSAACMCTRQRPTVDIYFFTWGYTSFALYVREIPVVRPRGAGLSPVDSILAAVSDGKDVLLLLFVVPRPLVPVPVPVPPPTHPRAAVSPSRLGHHV